MGLDIESYSIEFYTVYREDFLGGTYKVYQIKNYYTDSMDEYREQLETSNIWNRDKYYEYIMQEFYEIKEDNQTDIDRENLYYYHGRGAYAIFNLKNAKLYYFENYPLMHYEDYDEILGVNTGNYKTREIYSVRGGPQNDGLDYYTYEFTEEQDKEIKKTLENNTKWSKNKLEDDKLDDFEYNEEVLSIENGYYYGLVNRTGDAFEKENFIDEESTGYEIGVYDADNHILYFYWESY